MSADKTAWILPGGGSHAAYTAGALLGLRELNIPEPDIAIASSGSSGTIAYFMAGQFDSIRRIWCQMLSTKKFGNPWRIWKLMDVDYLIDDIVKTQEPLSILRVYASPVQLLVPMTDSKTGELKYFTAREGVDFFELLKAANAAPVFSGTFLDKRFQYYGRHYFDTRISSRPTQNIVKAIAMGAQKIIVLDNYHPKSSWTDGEFWYKAWLCTRNSVFRKRHLELLQQDRLFNNDSRIFWLRPRKPLGLAVWNNDRSKLSRAFDYGFRDTVNNSILRSFIVRK